MTDGMNPDERRHYLADAPPSLVRLEIDKHFDALNDQQKRYAHFISKACFAGTRIVLRQLSPESEHIFDLSLTLHKHCHGDWSSLARKTGVEESEIIQFLKYSVMFLGNLGNYKSFGDSNSEKPAAMHLGFPDAGHMSTYYPDSPTITKPEIEAVSAWMEKKGLLPKNTRLRKNSNDSYDILIASAATSVPADGGDIGKKTSFIIEDGPLKAKSITLIFGDYALEMKKIVAFVRKAAENAANDTQKRMHLNYATSYETGSLKAYKDSQRYWIRDKLPMVECNFGFVETYRDPAGVRGEWEGFTSMVNLERTRAFAKLVSAAPELIPLLPWSKDFEKDKFLSPDFTSLEVLTFNGSGIPAGINIPNYDDIRQTEGFKNVSLGNVLNAKAPHEKIPFISDDDLELYKKYRDGSFEVQVGLHELTGHGCGKLLQETSPGVFKFDKEHPPVNPLTHKPVTTWYGPGQTWSSVFGSIAASYEECRVELVAMYLSCEFPVLKIFGFGDGTSNMNGEAGDVLYASYLSMARAGLVSLEMWDPKSRNDFCKLDYAKDDLSDLTIKINRSKILTAGRDAVARYLQKLHIYKSTVDVDNGTNFYTQMTSVDPDFWGTKLRKVVMDNKQPRKVFVQANTLLDEASGKVSLRHYEASFAGMIQSWVDRGL